MHCLLRGRGDSRKGKSVTTPKTRTQRLAEISQAIRNDTYPVDEHWANMADGLVTLHQGGQLSEQQRAARQAYRDAIGEGK